MKTAIIDIGSNSVRLMIWADGKTLYKTLKTTRLGEGLNSSPNLLQNAITRTAQAIAEFCKTAKEAGADKIYAFATAAVRFANNKEQFIEAVYKLCGLQVDVISGETEAEIGLFGALKNADGGIIDVGGASTEVTVRIGGKVAYSKSVNIGTVRILDAAGRNLDKIDGFISEKISEYGERDFSGSDIRAVGGTASRLAAVKLGLKAYNPSLINGTKLTVEEIRDFAERFTTLSAEEIRKTTLLTKSADLIGGGAALLAAVMANFKITTVTVSESDNMEGYLNLKSNVK